MPKTKVVLHWVETDQSGVEDLSVLNEEDRYVGAKSSVKVGNKFHRCVVRLISSEYFLPLSFVAVLRKMKSRNKIQKWFPGRTSDITSLWGSPL